MPAPPQPEVPPLGPDVIPNPDPGPAIPPTTPGQPTQPGKPVFNADPAAARKRLFGPIA
ncbi:MAG: hypothetical protein R3E68_05775 [Burkholderiaceae bacterium]